MANDALRDLLQDVWDNMLSPKGRYVMEEEEEEEEEEQEESPVSYGTNSDYPYYILNPYNVWYASQVSNAANYIDEDDGIATLDGYSGGILFSDYDPLRENKFNEKVYWQKEGF